MTVQNTKLSGYNPNRQHSSIPSYLGLPRISGWKKFANLFKPDTPNKLKCDCLCTGRSMVEMLGVLAIVGVLSVGAIAGYSKAMFKYKLNKQTEQLNTLINAIARNAHSFDNINNKGYQIVTEYFIKMGEIPVEMIKKNDPYLYDVFGQQYIITLIYDKTWQEHSINLSTGEMILKNKSAENLEICRNMLMIAKENADNIATVTSVTRTDDNSAFMSTGFWGNKICGNDIPCLKDITLDTIYNFCTKFVGKNSNEFKITWI